MFIAIALFTAVGAMLAFRAKKFDTKYCTAAIHQIFDFCTSHKIDAQERVDATAYYATSTTNTAACNNYPGCTFLLKLREE